MKGFITNGANLIFVITNDGWWGDTPGYKQHLNYARLRAIEDFKKKAEEEKYFSAVKDQFESLKHNLQHDKKADLEKNKKEIMDLLAKSERENIFNPPLLPIANSARFA